MPLNSPEDYLRLGTHLEAIDPIFSSFLTEYNYRDNTGSLGRYPHRSALQQADVIRKIDLQMQTDPVSGQFYDVFDPSLPYTLWAGAWLDHEGVRYTLDNGIVVFKDTPFKDIPKVLYASLEEADAYIKKQTSELILQHGKASTKLGS